MHAVIKTSDDAKRKASANQGFNRRNDINPPRTIKQLNQLNLDTESPRLRAAMDNLGISAEELQTR